MVMAASGCSRSYSVAQDRSKAHHLLNQVYAGSLSSIQGELDPSIQKSHPDWVTSGISAALRQQFGVVRDLKLQSVEKAPMNSALAIWTVTAERGTYEMKVAFDSSSKVIGLSFRSSSLPTWTPSHVFGLDYLKQQKNRR
jgi:hypothetical protein